MAQFYRSHGSRIILRFSQISIVNESTQNKVIQSQRQTKLSRNETNLSNTKHNISAIKEEKKQQRHFYFLTTIKLVKWKNISRKKQNYNIVHQHTVHNIILIQANIPPHKKKSTKVPEMYL